MAVPVSGAGKEPDPSNSIDGCVHGTSRTYHSDELINQVIVRSGECGGTGSDMDMYAGRGCYAKSYLAFF
jgi:hypothetical protein